MTERSPIGRSRSSDGWCIAAAVTHGHTQAAASGLVVRKSVWRKFAESLAVVAAAVGLMAFGTFGTFDDGGSTFPHASLDDPR